MLEENHRAPKPHRACPVPPGQKGIDLATELDERGGRKHLSIREHGDMHTDDVL